ncbi:MAG TPA: MopE-related protein [Candidatus Polarisedimenticolia bacterium]|nr:MopE-related protein [Candidatus Polarisedimenticolia bacterium]
MRHRLSFALALASILVFAASASQARELSFQERVKAQEAIERVYFSHQIGTKTAFDQAVPKELLENKVQTYLKQSVALERIWHSPVTAEALSAELDRIARNTRFPDRLQEIYAALGNDPFLIQECFARPALVDRLTRSFFAADEGIHPASDGFDPQEARPVASSAASLPQPSVEASTTSCDPDDAWVNGSLDDFPDARSQNTAVWTGSLMLIWGGVSTAQSTSQSVLGHQGWRYDPLIDSWSRMSLVNAPQDRRGHTAIWTGNVMVVWGGIAGSVVNTGGRYDPVADSWSPTSLAGAPSARSGHSAVWSGSRMIVYGGTAPSGSPSPNFFSTGGRYDPVTDTWTPTSVPTFFHPDRAGHTAVWTGTEMIVWGGYYIPPNVPQGIFGLNSGGRYNPATDTWIDTPPVSFAQSERAHHSAVWTGSEMIIWGGVFYSFDPFRAQTTLIDLNTGLRFKPSNNTWTATLADGTAPQARGDHTAIWDGSRMIVWGGGNQQGFDMPGTKLYNPVNDAWTTSSASFEPFRRGGHTAVWTGSQMIVWGGSYNSGGRYHPASDTWTPTAQSAGAARAGNTAVWTGTQMIVWGGRTPIPGNPPALTNTGDRYDPLIDQWSPISSIGAPSVRSFATAVWTGQLMIVWGGGPADGGRYDPVADAWSPTSLVNSPESRGGHTAVWTGSRMVIWGGNGASGFLQTGSQYDPATNSWTPTSTVQAPSRRASHSAVWTGQEMIVWGGGNETGLGFADGGRYDPVADHWSNVQSTGAPAARSSHTAVWTGSEMIVWGGNAPGIALSTGGRYDPASDSWAPTSDTGAPSARAGHSSIWTGNRMIVWGGQTLTGALFDTGGIYNPAVDDWAPTSQVDAPLARSNYSAVWTGTQMLVWGGGLDTGGRYVLTGLTDLDHDGFSACEGDCNDADASIHPGATEVCDGVDQDCNQVVDDGGDTLCDDGNGCTQDQCTGAAGCSHPNSPNGSACSDANACTQVDACQAGVCVGADPVTCSSPDICSAFGTCNPADGTCSFTQAPDGTSCDDGNPCSSPDACLSGVCHGTVTPLGISVSLSPTTLKNAGHKMVTVVATVNAVTSCAGGPSVTLLSVTSDEPDDAPGPSDGHTINDIQGAALGTADFQFQVRAESDRNGDGRTYTVTYQATDSSGATASASATVVVAAKGNKTRTLAETAPKPRGGPPGRD